MIYIILLCTHIVSTFIIAFPTLPQVLLVFSWHDIASVA